MAWRGCPTAMVCGAAAPYLLPHVRRVMFRLSSWCMVLVWRDGLAADELELVSCGADGDAILWRRDEVRLPLLSALPLRHVSEHSYDHRSLPTPAFVYCSG